MPDMRATPIVYQGQQPAAAPFPKVVYSGITSAFGNNIYGIRRVSYVAQAGTTDQVIISPNGTCSNGLATPQSFVLAFGTQQAVDSYGLPILGGPAEPEPGNIFTQAVGTSSTRVVLGFKTTKGKGGRKLPWISGIQQGDGVTEDLYGTYDYITPDGVVHTAPGPKDKIVNTPRVRVKLAMSGSTDISYLKFTGDADPTYQNKGLAADIDKIKAAMSSGAGNSYKSGFGIEINGVTPPTGVTLALAAGAGLGIGLYDYLFTKRTSTHKESGPSAPLAITTTTGNQQVTITLPALDPTGDPLTIGYSIYRSPVGGTGTPISQCGGVTSTTDGTGKTTYQYQIPASYLLSYDPSILATPGTPPLPIDPATGLACTFDTMTGLFMSGMSVFDATLPQTYTSAEGYHFVADHGAGTYTDTASDASISSNKRPPTDNTPEIDTLLATVDETLHSPLKSGLINTGPSGGLKPLGRGLKINPATVGGIDISNVRIDGGDDGNGLIAEAPCPLFLECALPNTPNYGILNVGPGTWNGSAGDFHVGWGAFTADPIVPGYLNVNTPAWLLTPDGQGRGTVGTGWPVLTVSTPEIGTPTAEATQPFWLNIQGAPNGLGGGESFLEFTGTQLIYSSKVTYQPSVNANGVPLFQINGHNIDLEQGPAGLAGVTCDMPWAQSGNFIASGSFSATGAALLSAGATISNSALITGASTATAGTSSQVPFTISGVAGQTANLINLTPTPGGGSVFSVDPTGSMTALGAHFTGTATLINDGRSDHKAIAAPATPASGYTSLYSRTVSGTTKLYYKDDGGTEYLLGASSGGTVTSVALTAPSILTVAGSPVTGSGTIALTLATQAANTVFAGPTSGGAATPAFRGLVAADIPDLSATYALAGTTGTGTDHLHGLARWVAGGGATFDLPDLAEYTEMVFDNGSAVDEATVTLSADHSQLVFDSAPTSGHVLQATYVIARI